MRPCCKHILHHDDARAGMITPVEVVYATYGAWRLARFDCQGLQYFDNTPEAFWRSFYAAVIVAPPFAVLTALQLAEVELTSGRPASCSSN